MYLTSKDYPKYKTETFLREEILEEQLTRTLLDNTDTCPLVKRHIATVGVSRNITESATVTSNSNNTLTIMNIICNICLWLYQCYVAVYKSSVTKACYIVCVYFTTV